MRFEFGDTVVEVNTPSQPALAQAVARRFEAQEGFAVATLNLDHLVKFSTNPRFRAAYQMQDLIVADGNPVVWLSRIARRPVDLVPGADLVVPISQQAAEAGVTVGLVGSTDDVLEGAAATLRDAAPGIEIVAEIAPSMGFDPDGPEADAVFEDLKAAEARLIFLALGAPKQEIMAARGRIEMPDAGFVSIGAGLDFLAGAQIRAPLWVRRVAMEWLWRMMSNPRRLAKRYIACAAILPSEVAGAIRMRHTADETPTTTAPPVKRIKSRSSPSGR